MDDASPSHPAHLVVIGIGADGWASLGELERRMIEKAPIVLGGARHLDLLPPISGQERRAWPSPLRAALPALLEEYAGRRVVALASGDPLVSGIGTTLINVLGPDQVSIQPAISSVALARQQLLWSAETHATVSVVGRDVSLVRRELAPGRRILVLSSDERTPHEIAALVVDAGYRNSHLTVLGDLGSEQSSCYEFPDAELVTLDDRQFPRLNIVAIECTRSPERAGAGATTHVASWVAGLPDDAFEHDGQLTKRDLRASALARLAPVPGEHLWDVGAGAGSVGIEWMRAHPSCTATAVEGNPERAARIARNAGRLGVPGLRVVEGRAPDALAGLPRPDAIFVGGGATAPGVIDACLAALSPGGRLVVHGVTLETEQLLASLHQTHGGDLVRISVESATPIGTFTGWTPARTVTQWALVTRR